jgi:hypothetical protein
MQEKSVNEQCNLTTFHNNPTFIGSSSQPIVIKKLFSLCQNGLEGFSLLLSEEIVLQKLQN